MNVLSLSQRFDSAAGCLSNSIVSLLEPLPGSVKEQAQEIRLRIGKPLTLHTGHKHLFVGMDYNIYEHPSNQVYTVTYEDVNESFKRLCEYSVHAHLSEIRDGYISVKGGHRAGLSGTAVIQDGHMTGLRDITSINLRIAKEICGAATELAKRLSYKPYGMLVAGAPSSGKTTILRDLARQLGGGARGCYYKVAVVDERGELGACSGGTLQNDLGCCTDILTGYRKGEGIVSAVRSLSPQIVICDEIGTDEEIEAVVAGLNSGVVVIASVHAGNKYELLNRPQIRRLLDTGAFQEVVFLEGAGKPSSIKEIYKVGDLHEDSRNTYDFIKLSDNGFNYGISLK